MHATLGRGFVDKMIHIYLYIISWKLLITHNNVNTFAFSAYNSKYDMCL